MNIIFANQPIPEEIPNSIFCAGPTPRSGDVDTWRPNAIEIFRNLDYSGSLLIPEDESWGVKAEYEDQVEWEELGLTHATCIMFWIPRDLETLPGFTTNDEWGTWKYSGKCVLGTPPNAAKVRYQRHYARKIGVPTYDTLEDTVAGAIKLAQLLRNGDNT